MKYQNFLMALTIVTVVGSVFASSFTSVNGSTGMHSAQIYTTVMCNKVTGADGTIKQPWECSPRNNITTVGLNWVRDKISGSNASGVMTNIWLGNTSTAEADLTSLPGQQNKSLGCTLGPATGTVAYSPNGVANYSVSYVWTQSGCPGIIINTTALYNTTDPGLGTCTGNCTMFAGKNFSNSVTLQNSDQLNVTWYVWATSGG